MEIFQKLFHLLNQRERWHVLFLLCLMVVMSFVEVLGIASIMPFIAVLSSPESIQSNDILKSVYNYFEFSGSNGFLFMLGGIVFSMLLLGNLIKAITRLSILKFSYFCGYTLSLRLFRVYLWQPYCFFLDRNSGRLTKNVLGEVQGITTNIIIPLMDTISKLFVIFFIFALICIIDPYLASLTILILGGSFALIYYIFRNRIFRLGNIRFSAQTERFKLVNEAIHGIKNIKLTGHENTYLKLFEAPSFRFASTLSSSGVIRELPRFILEIVAFGSIMIILLYLITVNQNLDDALPIISLYAYSGYRLLPSSQAIYANMNKIRFNLPVLNNIEKEISELSQLTLNAHESITEPLPFNNSIRIEALKFSYNQEQKPIVDDLSFEIKPKETIGVVGKTGSGKTTLVDIIIGLLRPCAGTIYVDDVPLIADNIAAWQKNISYVSQHIYLSDDSVRKNIAFGVPSEEIDNDLVIEASKMAQINEFIESELPQGFDTQIGENGIRLSGGQRQRIALARALYLNRPIIVLDEATSALDQETEEFVMEAIDNLSNTKTIIMITHRKTTLKNCDHVIRLGDDKI